MDTNKRQTLVEYLEQEYQGKVRDEKFDLKMELAIAGDATVRMIDILYDDTKSALEGLEKDSNSQFWRRTFVRTIFAHIEAQLSIMRQSAVTWHRLGAIKLADKDLRKLADEIRLTWDASQIPGPPIRLSLAENIKFSFTVFGLTPVNPIVAVDTDSQGWQSLLVAIKIRDNLTHPKIEQNLLINDSDAIKVMAGWFWFSELSTLAFQKRYLPNNSPYAIK